MLTLREDLRNLPANHLSDKLLTVDLSAFAGGDASPIAQDGDAVRQVQHFIKAMRNVDDAEPSMRKLANGSKEGFGLGVVQRSGGFIEHEQTCIVGKRLGNLNQLLLSDAKASGYGIGRDVRTQAREQLARILVNFRPPHRSSFCRQPA